MKYLLFLLAFSFASCRQMPSEIVTTDKGQVAGSFNADKSLRIFKGIPFAAPPVGDLRWRAPQEATAWEGVRSCTAFGASPIQNKPVPFYCWTEEFIAQPEPLSEDCLYLNVWTPATEPESKLPVFVWIYGGGLVSGSANCDIYDGAEMAKQGVVFVSLNYRVGAMGFMAHPALSAAAESGTSGNYGLLDQMAALRWVQRNIAAFGGDPNNVTIAGQSAGAFSVNALIASQRSKDLFHKAILQSGGLLSNRLPPALAEGEKTGQRLMEAAGVQSIEAFRQIPAEQLQALSNDAAIGRFGF
ncbi:MAG: carboxylesterase family protein, partial [Bacteroidota bacterium]